MTCSPFTKSFSYIALMTVVSSLSPRFANKIEFLTRLKINALASYVLGMFLNSVDSRLLKEPNTSSEIPILLLFLPFCLAF